MQLPEKTFTVEQHNIIRHQHGIALAIAGPGSGKSTSITECIRFLILVRGVKPEQILVLTFNEKTEQDLKKRLNNLLGAQATQVEILTYHAFGLKLIRQYYSMLGFSKKPQVTTVSGLSQWQRRRQNLVDFEDMLIMPHRLRWKDPEIFQIAIAPYRHLLVDELQDINNWQASLVLRLAKLPTMESAVLVGDRKQSIYTFRGALPEHWLRIQRVLKPKIYPLSQTHRLPKSSLALVNGVGAEICDDPPLCSNRIAGGKPQWQVFTTTDGQADFIAHEIRRLLQRGVPAHEIACLARHRWNLGRLSQALAQRGIQSCELYRDHHDHEPVRRLIQLLRLVKDLRQAGASTQKKAAVFARRRKGLGRLLRWLLMPPKTVGRICRQLATRGLEAIQVKKKPNETFYRQVLAFRKAISEAIDCAKPERAAQLLIDVLRGPIKQRDPKLLDFYLRDLSEVKRKVRTHSTWQALRPKELYPQEPTAAIQLMTAHGAKGKEWQYVFVIDCVEGQYPSYTATTQEEIEEEQRVFYVILTRHKEQLYLLQAPFPHQHFTAGKKSGRHQRRRPVYTQASRFLVQQADALDSLPRTTGR